MIDNFPRLRRRALEELQRRVPLSESGLEEPREITIKFLSDEKVPSFILPSELHVVVEPGAADYSELRLPFPSVVLEWGAAILYTYEIDGYFCLFLTVMSHRGIFIALPGIRIPKSTYRGLATDAVFWHGSANEFLDKVPPHLKEQINYCYGRALATLYDFLVLCNCSNVEKAKIYEPSAALLKRSRERKKIPPHTYWELRCFDSKSGTTTNAGGNSHASPRFHVRRGHVRRLATGRTVWVRNTTVGSPLLGIAAKSYKL